MKAVRVRIVFDIGRFWCPSRIICPKEPYCRLAPPEKSAVGLLVMIWIRPRSEEHTSELQSLMRISYAVFCLKKKNQIPLVLHEGQSHRRPLSVRQYRHRVTTP